MPLSVISDLSNLANLLDATRPLFDISIKNLEDLTNDRRLYRALDSKIARDFTRFCKRELEIDPQNTSGEQIYKKLMLLIWQKNNLVLNKYLGLKEDSTLEQILNQCINFTSELDLPTNCFRLKNAVAKKMLVNNPPPNAMRLLGYDDVSQMLKEVSFKEVYSALRFSEGDRWLDNFNLQYKKLKPSDFTRGKTEVLKMPLRWAPLTKNFITKKKHNITHLKELGIVVVIETVEPSLIHGVTLKALPLIVHYYYEVHLYSSFFKKLAATHKNNPVVFGEILSDTILASPKIDKKDMPTDVNIAHQDINWRVIQRYYGKLNAKKDHPEIFEPHLQPEDIHWDKAESILGRAIPELLVFEDLDYVALLKDGQPVSLNLMDLSLSFANKDRYGDHLFYHFRESLWNEIFATYLGQDELENQLLAKLNNSLVSPSSIKSS